MNDSIVELAGAVHAESAGIVPGSDPGQYPAVLIWRTWVGEDAIGAELEIHNGGVVCVPMSTREVLELGQKLTRLAEDNLDRKVLRCSPNGEFRFVQEGEEIVVEVRVPDLEPFDIRVPGLDGLEQMVNQLQAAGWPR